MTSPVKPLVIFDMNGVLGTRRKGVFTPFPGVGSFLKDLSTVADVGIWSSARFEVVHAHVRTAFPDVAFAHVWTRSDAPDTRTKPYAVVAAVTEHRPCVLMVDDAPTKLASTWPTARTLIVDSDLMKTGAAFEPIRAWATSHGTLALPRVIQYMVK